MTGGGTPHPLAGVRFLSERVGAASVGALAALGARSELEAVLIA